MTDRRTEFVAFFGKSYAGFRIRGDHEPCIACDHEIEVFNRDALKASFLIVRVDRRQSLGGGRCVECETCFCIGCATMTVYGAGMRRLHCPECGRFLVGLRFVAKDTASGGAFLDEPPEFSGNRATMEVGDERNASDANLQ
jgi:hypothetical protein